MSDQNKCQGCGVTATWKDGKPFDVLVATDYDESARNVIWSCTDCIFLSGLGEPKEVPVAARCYRWFWGEKCSKPRRSTTNHWKFCSDECCDIMRKEVEAREANNKHHPTKGDTAPMSQPITEQDVADYLTKFIQTSELVPDQMKALFIGRVTNWGNPVGAQPVAQDSTEKPAPSAEVARMTDTAAPLPMTITKDDDGCFFIAIGDRKWKICRPGIIGINEKDRWEFNDAACKLSGCELPFSEAGRERVVLASELLSLSDYARSYRNAMAYRASVKKTLGEVMYGAYCDSLPSSEPKQPAWEDVVHKYSWETAATAAYLSVGLDLENINHELQIVAARKRMLLLRSVGVWGNDIQKTASDIALIAGPTPQP